MTAQRHERSFLGGLRESVVRRVGQHCIYRCCGAVGAHRNLPENLNCALPVSCVDCGIPLAEQARRDKALVDRHPAEVRTLSTHVTHGSAQPPEPRDRSSAASSIDPTAGI
jgi:hypothetical protein